MHTKQIGDVGESAAIYNFIKNGIFVSIPFGEGQPYDLIVDIMGKLLKIQVKTSSGPEDQGSKIAFSLRSSHMTSSGSITKSYSINDFDYYYLYCKKNNMSFLIKNDGLNINSFTIRLIEPKNNQKEGINMYYDFEFDKVIKELCASNSAE